MLDATLPEDGVAVDHSRFLEQIPAILNIKVYDSETSMGTGFEYEGVELSLTESHVASLSAYANRER